MVFDPVGGDVFDESMRCIAPFGRILIVGFVGGRAALAKTNHLLIKDAEVIGYTAGATAYGASVTLVATYREDESARKKLNEPDTVCGIPAGMFDPSTCACMVLGPPRVSVQALQDLRDLLRELGCDGPGTATRTTGPSSPTPPKSPLPRR